MQRIITPTSDLAPSRERGGRPPSPCLSGMIAKKLNIDPLRREVVIFYNEYINTIDVSLKVTWLIINSTAERRNFMCN
jgi:hypothetical protein